MRVQYPGRAVPLHTPPWPLGSSLSLVTCGCRISDRGNTCTEQAIKILSTITLIRMILLPLTTNINSGWLAAFYSGVFSGCPGVHGGSSSSIWRHLNVSSQFHVLRGREGGDGRGGREEGGRVWRGEDNRRWGKKKCLSTQTHSHSMIPKTWVDWVAVKRLRLGWHPGGDMPRTYNTQS